MTIAKMRTIQQIALIYKENDPDTAITANYIRGLVKKGVLKHHRAGKKFLINLEHLEDFLQNSIEPEQETSGYGKLRKIN